MDNLTNLKMLWLNIYVFVKQGVVALKYFRRIIGDPVDVKGLAKFAVNSGQHCISFGCIKLQCTTPAYKYLFKSTRCS